MKKANVSDNSSTNILSDHISSKKDPASPTLGTDDRIELARKEAYIDPKTRELLTNLLKLGDTVEILPTYSTDHYLYKITDLAEGGDFLVMSLDSLQKLANLDILKKSFYDSTAVCPHCQSTVLTFHNRCPKCKSHNVEKTSLTEHIPCGYINQRDKYVNDRCPQCGELLVEGQYRNMGRWYVCQKCGDRFENPEYDLVCRSCNKNFAIKEAQVIDIPKFSINHSRKKEIRQNVASLEDIRKLLVKLGFNVEMPGLTVGEKSGMEHHFSIIAKKCVNGQEIVVALDHAISDSEVQASPLILYIYKTSEVKVDIPIFVAIPKMHDTAKKIAQGHNILLIDESTRMEDVEKHMEKLQLELLQRQVEVPKAEKAEKSPQEKGSFLSKFIGKKPQAASENP